MNILKINLENRLYVFCGYFLWWLGKVMEIIFELVFKRMGRNLIGRKNE